MPVQASATDQPIGDDEFVYRRARPDQIIALEDGTGYRPSSAIITSKGGPLSGDLSSGSTPAQTRDRGGGAKCHVVAIPVSALLEEGCKILRAPEPDNPSHVHVWGPGRADGAIGGKPATRIARKSRVVLFCPNVQLPDGSQH